MVRTGLGTALFKMSATFMMASLMASPYCRDGTLDFVYLDCSTANMSINDCWTYSSWEILGISSMSENKFTVSVTI